MHAPGLRPLGIGESLDVAIKIVTRNAGTLLGAVAVVVVPVQLLAVVVQGLTLPDPSLISPFQFRAQPGGPDAIDLIVFTIGSGLAGLLALVAALVATGACFQAVGEAYLGRPTNWRRSLRLAARRVHSLLWLFVLAFLPLFLAFFVVALAAGAAGALIGPVATVILVLVLLLVAVPLFTWLAIAWTPAVPALFFEDVRGVRALGRSYRLVRGRWWPTLAVLSLAFVFYFVLSLVFGALIVAVQLTDLGRSVVAVLGVSAVTGAISSVLTTPFLAAATAVVYFDLRVRKEGFDLQLVAQSIGVEPSGPSPPEPAGAASAPGRPEAVQQAPRWPPPSEQQAPPWPPPSEQQAPRWPPPSGDSGGR